VLTSASQLLSGFVSVLFIRFRPPLERELLLFPSEEGSGNRGSLLPVGLLGLLGVILF